MQKNEIWNVDENWRTRREASKLEKQMENKEIEIYLLLRLRWENFQPKSIFIIETQLTATDDADDVNEEEDDDGDDDGDVNADPHCDDHNSYRKLYWIFHWGTF